MMRTMPVLRLAVMASLLSLGASQVLAAGGENQRGSEAAHAETKLPEVHWSFDGPLGTFDRAAAQRGFQVWKEVCSNCHSMKLAYYRNLAGIGLNEGEIKAIAASAQVPGGFDDTGAPVERPGLPSDHFRSPFPNDKAARAANGGALPPDHSLIVKAREDGANYLHALLTGYKDAPADVKVPDGQYYNEYYPGHLLAMAQPLTDGQVTYEDGTQASIDQMSRDVTQFLTWVANPEMEQRKQMGVKVVLFLILMTALTYAVKRKVWKDVH